MGRERERAVVAGHIVYYPHGDSLRDVKGNFGKVEADFTGKSESPL